MEQEAFISGYCRCLDGSRTVAVEMDGVTWEADCSFGSCPYEDCCTVAQRIRELTNP